MYHKGKDIGLAKGTPIGYSIHELRVDIHDGSIQLVLSGGKTLWLFFILFLFSTFLFRFRGFYCWLQDGNLAFSNYQTQIELCTQE